MVGVALRLTLARCCVRFTDEVRGFVVSELKYERFLRIRGMKLTGDISDRFKLRPAGAASQNEWGELLEKFKPNFPELHLVHITHAGVASQILRLDPPTLKAMPCQVFDGHKRLYFFVMRPLYRVHEGDVEQTLVSWFPVAFVFTAKELGEPAHAAQFDTGAAYRKRYDDRHSPGAYLDDYLLEPDLDAVRRFLSWGYQSAEAYFKGKLREGLVKEIPNFMSIAHSWLQIARDAAPGGDKDLRGAAVEVAYDRGFLLEGNIKLCVFPDELLQDKISGKSSSIRIILEEKKIPYKVYKWERGKRPNDHLAKINAILRIFYSDNGIFA